VRRTRKVNASVTGTIVQDNRFRLEGLFVDHLTLDATAQRICSDVRQGSSFTVFTMNLDHVVKLRRSNAFRRAYERAKIILPDGFPIALAGRLQGKRNVRRATGSDLILPLCAEAERTGVPVAFLGSTFASLSGAARHLHQRFPGLEIAAVISPKQNMDLSSIETARELDFIAASGARICFVALGAPKQELLADKALGQVQGMAFVCIGAGLDFLAGHQQRAPKIFQHLALEWAWRLALSPQRLARRYLDCLAVLPSVIWMSLNERRTSG
jgi:exopolysaccharide biosynthesis WecB/TagA/CpsF family protein